MFEQRDLRVRSTNTRNMSNLMTRFDSVRVRGQWTIITFKRFQFSNLIEKTLCSFSVSSNSIHLKLTVKELCG